MTTSPPDSHKQQIPEETTSSHGKYQFRRHAQKGILQHQTTKGKEGLRQEEQKQSKKARISQEVLPFLAFLICWGIINGSAWGKGCCDASRQHGWKTRWGCSPCAPAYAYRGASDRQRWGRGTRGASWLALWSSWSAGRCGWHCASGPRWSPEATTFMYANLLRQADDYLLKNFDSKKGTFSYIRGHMLLSRKGHYPTRAAV